MPLTSFDYPNTVRNFLASEEFNSFPDEQKPFAIEAFRSKFINENEIKDEEEVSYVNTKSSEIFGKYRQDVNIPRYTPTPEESAELYGKINLNEKDPVEKRVQSIEEWRDAAIPKASQKAPSIAEDFSYHVEDLANNLIKSELAKDSYKPGGMPDFLTDSTKRFTEQAIKGLGVDLLADYKEANRFFAKNLVENPEFDNDFSSQVVGGLGNVLSQVALSAGMTAAGAPELIAPTLLTMSTARHMTEAYNRELKRTGNELVATDAAVNAIPAGIIDAGPEILLGGMLNKVKGFADAYKLATTEVAKKAVIKEYIPLASKEFVKQGLNEGLLGGVGTDVAGNLGDYYATGDEQYLKNATNIGELARSFAVEGTVGAMVGAGIAGLTKGSNQADVSATIAQLTDAGTTAGLADTKAKEVKIFEAIKSGNYDKAIEISKSSIVASDKIIKGASQGNNKPPLDPPGTPIKDSAEATLKDRLGADLVEQSKIKIANKPYTDVIDKTIKSLDPVKDQAKIDQLNKTRSLFENETGPVAFQEETEFESTDTSFVFKPEKDYAKQTKKPFDVTLQDDTKLKNDNVVYVKQEGMALVKNANLIKALGKPVTLQTSPNGRLVKFKGQSKQYEASPNPQTGWVPVIVSGNKIKILAPVREATEIAKQEPAEAIDPAEVKPKTSLVDDSEVAEMEAKVEFENLLEKKINNTITPTELTRYNELEKTQAPVVETETIDQTRIDEATEKLNKNTPQGKEAAAPAITKPTSRKKKKAETQVETPPETVVEKTTQEDTVEPTVEPVDIATMLVHQEVNDVSGNKVQVKPATIIRNGEQSSENVEQPTPEQPVNMEVEAINSALKFQTEKLASLEATDPRRQGVEQIISTLNDRKTALVPVVETTTETTVAPTVEPTTEETVVESNFVKKEAIEIKNGEWEVLDEYGEKTSPHYASHKSKKEAEDFYKWQQDQVFYHGQEPGSYGHYDFISSKGVNKFNLKKETPSKNSIGVIVGEKNPWQKGEYGFDTSNLLPGNDGYTYVNGKQELSKPIISHKNGWTALAFVDRTLDKRAGAHGAFFTHGVLSIEEMLNRIELYFPGLVENKKIRDQLDLKKQDTPQQVDSKNNNSNLFVTEKPIDRGVLKQIVSFAEKGDLTLAKFDNLISRGFMSESNFPQLSEIYGIPEYDGDLGKFAQSIQAAIKKSKVKQPSQTVEQAIKETIAPVQNTVQEEPDIQSILQQEIEQFREETQAILKQQREDTPENTARRKEQTDRINELAKDVGLKNLTIVNTHEELNRADIDDAVQGFVEGGQVVMILDNIIPYEGESQIEATERIFKHEVVGHLKLSGVLSGISPEGFNNLVKFLKTLKWRSGDNVWERTKAAYTTETVPDDLEIVDEIFAKLTENKDKESVSLINKIINWVRVKFLKAGIANWTPNDLDIIIQTAFDSEITDNPGIRMARSQESIYLDSNIRGYGAWIAPNGKIIDVGYQAHFDKAADIIGEEALDGMTVDGVYNEMAKRGYVRVINGSSILVDEQFKLSPVHKAVLEFAGINGDKNVIIGDKYLYKTPTTTRFSKSGPSSEKGEIGFDKKQMLKLLGPSMYNKPIAQVAVKELLQNSFDALKAASSKFGQKNLNIDFKIDIDNRTISITDNGVGMTKDIVKKAFLTIGGTDKDGLSEGQRSGGLGLAKVQFLLGSESVKINTVRDGVRTTINATSLELYEDNFEINTEKTDDKNGTNVEIKIPLKYTTLEGVEKEISFPGTGYATPKYTDYDILTKPLIGNVNATIEFVKKGTSKKETLPIGNAIKPGEDNIYITDTNSQSAYKSGDIISQEEFKKENDRLKDIDKWNYISGTSIVSPALFSKIEFDWGSADLYISESKKEHPKHVVLSSGLYQFRKVFSDNNYKDIPYDIVVDIKPKVSATSEQYPFNNQREDFKPTVKEDIEALNLFINQFASGESQKEIIEVFRDIKALPKTDAESVLTPEEREKLFASVEEINRRNKPIEREERTVSDIYIKERSVFEKSTNKKIIDVKEEQEKKYQTSFKPEKKIDNKNKKNIDLLDQDVPQFHNNTTVDYTQTEGANLFFADIGSVLLDFVRFVGFEIPGYEKLTGSNEKLFTGVSIDKTYGGVHIRNIFNAVFINPLAFDPQTTEEAVGVALHVMIHEINHTNVSNEGAEFTTSLANLYGKIYGTGRYGYFEGLVRSVYSKHFETFKELKKQYDKSSTRNISKSFTGEQISTGNPGPIQGDEANVSDGETATGRDTGDRSDNSGADKTGDVALSNINKNIRFSKSQPSPKKQKAPVTEDNDLDWIVTDNEIITQSKSKASKEIAKLIKRTYEQKLIIKEVQLNNAFKDVQYAFLSDSDVESFLADYSNFVNTRNKHEDPATERIPVDELERRLIDYKKKANKNEYEFYAGRVNGFPEFSFFNEDAGAARAYFKELTEEKNDDTASVVINDSDIATMDAVVDLQFQAIEAIDDVNDIINRGVVDLESGLIESGNTILDSGIPIIREQVGIMRKLFNEYALSLITTDATSLSGGDLRRVYYSLLSLVTDGYPNRLEGFISSETTEILRDMEARFRDPYGTKKKNSDISKLESNSSQIERLATDGYSYDLLTRLQAPFREGLVLAKRYHEEVITPYIESLQKDVYNGVLDADMANKIGMFGILRQRFLVETPEQALKQSVQWVLDSNKNTIGVYDKDFDAQGKRHQEYLEENFLSGINYTIEKGQITSDFTPEDVAKFYQNANIFIGDKGVQYADGIVKMYDALKPLSRFTTEFIYGRPFEEIENYIPTMSVIIKGEGDTDFDLAKPQLLTDAKSFSSGQIFYGTNTSGLGSTKSRTRKVGTNRSLVFNVNYAGESLGRIAVYDYFTAHARQEMSQLLNHKNKNGKLFAKFLGDPEQKRGRTDAFRSAMNGTWQNVMSQASYMHSYHVATNWLGRKFAQAVLSGAHQLPAQLVSNTTPYFVQHINEPRKIGNYFKAAAYILKHRSGLLEPHQSRIVDKIIFEVTHRQQFQEIDKSVNLDINPKSITEMIKKEMPYLYKAIVGVDKGIENVLFKAFKLSDTLSGAPMMLAEYLNSEQDSKGSHVRIEDLTYDSVSYIKAIDATERYIGIGDASRRGEFLTNKNAAISIGRNLLVAFRSFSINNAVNFGKELRRLFDSNVSREQKAQSFKYMMGIAAQSVTYTMMAYAVQYGMASAIAHALKNPEEEEELKKLYSKSQNRMTKNERRMLNAEISMREKNRKVVNNIQNRTNDTRILAIKTAKDALSNMFIPFNLEFVPNIIIHVGSDGPEADVFKAWKSGEVERIQKLIKRNKALENRKTVTLLNEELANIEMQEFLPAVYEQRTIANIGGSFGGTVEGIIDAIDSGSKFFMKPEAISPLDFVNLAAAIGVSQPDIKRFFRASSLVEKSTKERDEQLAEYEQN